MPIAKPEELSDRMRATKGGVAAAIVLVLIFLAQCISAAKRDSVSWDESQHLYSGWLSWKQADFGFNPEVPPLVKMWCAIPLLHRDIAQPAYIGGSFKKKALCLANAS